MKRAVKAIFLATGQVAELSGAASTAAAFKLKEQLAGRKVVLLLSGGNIQHDQLASILTNVILLACTLRAGLDALLELVAQYFSVDGPRCSDHHDLRPRGAASPRLL